jgi:exonuclease III
VRTEYTASAFSTEEFNSTSVTIPSSHTEVTCYNQFLNYYNYPTLDPNQTLESFIQHLTKLNHKLPFKISINFLLKETHIYNDIFDPLLPQHTLLHPTNYFKFFNLPIRSQTSNNSLLLNIATHNIKGYNQSLKRKLWEEYCLSNNLHIISLTETKISAQNTALQFFNTKDFSYFWANLETSAEGTCIMINNTIKPHIHNIHTHLGGAIAIDLFFKNNFKFRIISVYLSSTNSVTRQAIQNKVIHWIQNALSANLLPIILGDFNTYTEYQSSYSAKTKLLSFLQSQNMYDLLTTLQQTNIPGKVVATVVELTIYGHTILIFHIF